MPKHAQTLQFLDPPAAKEAVHTNVVITMVLTAPAKFLAGNLVLALVAMLLPTLHEDLKLLPGLQFFPAGIAGSFQRMHSEVLQTSPNLEQTIQTGRMSLSKNGWNSSAATQNKIDINRLF